ncbi:MAG TPA: transposase [Streptosporangiaceae bacterium]|nr:transposase [Streptosporangiaceae bacterium]
MLHAVARLAEIPGISPMLARAIIAEVGLDMARFPTAGHLVSWAGLCPPARQSGPRTRAGKKGQGNTWLRGHLGQAAAGAARTATFLGERYHRIARRRGKAKAQVAVARSILVITCTCWPARPPGTPTSATATTRTAPTKTASSVTTCGRSKRSASPSPLTRPSNPIPPLTRPEHRVRTGSAAARPFTVSNFPVSSGSLGNFMTPFMRRPCIGCC